ncbi:hypothetical protein O181_110639 [Austropuccinia psidii MF-1]|uniref:Uncharacterized protein n=1 Tax=Austropuccinia psidii MF-1 TaxID=1389203 RepID=A0A9Q3K0E6_9BASI|nr:hypothetical protein [Austropuccinia psidii MF-1]
MARTKPNIENHDFNNTKQTNRRKLTQSQRQHIYDSKQIMSQLGPSNRSYKNAPSISIVKKVSNATWLNLPSLNTLPHPYVIIDKTKNPSLPFVIYEITPFDNSSGNSDFLQSLVIALMSISQNW